MKERNVALLCLFLALLAWSSYDALATTPDICYSFDVNGAFIPEDCEGTGTYVVPSPMSDYTSSGKIGGARDCEQSNSDTDEVNASTKLSLSSANICTGCWVKYESASATDNRDFFSKGNGNLWNIGQNVAGEGNKFVTRITGAAGAFAPVNPSTASFYYVVGTYDGVTQYIYVNGTLIGTQASAYTPGTALDDLFFCGRSADLWDGIIDECFLMRSNCTQAIVTEFYQRTVPWGSNAPIITQINFTSDGGSIRVWGNLTNTTDSTPTVELTTDINAQCKFAADADVNYTSMNNSCTQNGNYNTTHSCTFASALALGNHTVYYTCNSSAGIMMSVPAANSSKMNLTISAPPVYPNVTLVSPTNSTTILNSHLVTLNFTTTGNTPTQSCSLYINITPASINAYNNASVLNNTVTSYPIWLNKGRYNWSVNCTDTDGDKNISPGKFFRVNDTEAPNTRLQTPANNSVLSGSVNFFFIANDSFENNFSCTLYVNHTAKATNATVLNNTNTSLTYTILSTERNWYVNCTDATGNMNTSGIFGFEPIGYINVTLDNVSASRKYEIQRTVAINTTTNYTGTICLDIYSVVNYTCFNGSLTGTNTSYVIDNLTVTKANLTKLNVTFTGNASFYVELDNRTELVNASVRIYGVSTAAGLFPANVTFDQDGDGVFDFAIPCSIEGNLSHCRYFTYDSALRQSSNVTFATAGSQTFYVNISTIGLERFNASTNESYGNFTVNITGLEQNAGQQSNHRNNFTKTENSNVSNLSNASIGMVFSGLALDMATATIEDCGTIGFTNGVFSGTCYRAGQSSDFYSAVTQTNRTAFDARDWYNITVIYSGSVSVTSAGGDGYIDFIMTDSDATNNNVILYSDGRSNSGALPYNDQLINFVSYGYPVAGWEVYRAGTLIGTVDSGALDQSRNWSFAVRLRAKKSCCSSGDVSISASATMNISSIQLNVNATTTRKSSGEVLSGVVRSTTTNVTSLYFDANDLRRTVNQTITYSVSCNNGTNWTVATKGTNNVCAVQGNLTRWKAKITNPYGPDENKTAYIHDVTLNILGGVPLNVSLDVGVDGFVDWIMRGYMNGTNASLIANPSANTFIEYANKTCKNKPTCLVPVKLTSASAGIVQMTALNLSSYLKPFVLNVTKLDNGTDRPTMVSNHSGGNLTWTDFKWLFFGSANLTVLAHTPDYSFNGTTYDIQARYSLFDVNFPPAIDYWEVPLTKPNVTNAKPVGQNNTRGIWQFDSHAYEDPMDIYIRSNETYNSCLKIWLSRFNITISPQLLNTSYGDASARAVVDLNVSQTGVNVWEFVNATNCPRTGILDFDHVFDSQCQGCVRKFT